MKQINAYINEKLVLNKDSFKKPDAGPYAAECEKNKNLSEDELENVLLWKPNDIFYWYHDNILEFSKLIKVNEKATIEFYYLDKEKNNIGFYPIDHPIDHNKSRMSQVFFLDAENRNKCVCRVSGKPAKLWDGTPIEK